MMPTRLFEGARFTPITVVLTVLGLLTVWPVGLAIAAYALWGERFGWRPRVEGFLQGIRSGLRSGASCCGPSIFFSGGRCSLDRTPDEAARRRPER